MAKFSTSYHKFYNTEKEQERFMTESYIGGKMYANDKNLFRYINENKDKFKKRLERSYLINCLQPIVSEIKNTIFAKDIRRDSSEKELFNLFIEKATKSGENLSEFMQDLAIYGCLYKVGVLVDGSNFSGEIEKSVRDKNRLFASVSVLLPHQIMDYYEDARGVIQWVLLDCSYCDKSVLGQSVEVKKYVYWDKLSFTIYTSSDNGEFTSEQIPHDLGEVPFFFFKKKELHRDPLATSIFEDVAILQKAIYNYYSLIDENIYASIMPMLLSKVASTPFNEETKKGTGFSLTDNVFYYEEVAPQLLKPEFLDPQVILNIIETLTKEVYRKVGDYIDANNMYAQSGTAKEIDREKRSNALTNYSKQLENAENHILRLFGKWENIEFTNYDESVYPDNFDITSFMDRIENALKLSTMFANSPTAQNAIRKDVLENCLGDKLTPEEKKKIEEELQNPQPDFT